MNFKSTPISYSKVNPLGQLIIGLEDGTIFNSGSVFGPTGKQGPVGDQGPRGPAGPTGSGIASLHSIGGHLHYTLENNPQQYYDAGKLPYVQGPTGKNGTSIVNFRIEHDNILMASTSDYHNIIAGKINTIQGPTGPRGQMGPSGVPFTLSNIFIDDQHQLNVTDDRNKTYKCGHVGGCTGPTGPPTVWDNAFTDQNGHLILLCKNKFLDAGYVMGPTGPPSSFKSIEMSSSGSLLFTDDMDRTFDAGKILPNDELQLLRDKVEALSNRVAELETRCVAGATRCVDSSSTKCTSGS